MKYLTKKQNLAENLKIELMATLRKRDSGLPVNLYLDDVGSWSKSGPWRIVKFQSNTRDCPEIRNVLPITIDDDPRILAKSTKISLNEKQIEQVKAFVRNNKESLLLLSDSKIDIFEFGRRMKTI